MQTKPFFNLIESEGWAFSSTMFQQTLLGDAQIFNVLQLVHFSSGRTFLCRSMPLANP